MTVRGMLPALAAMLLTALAASAADNDLSAMEDALKAEMQRQDALLRQVEGEGAEASADSPLGSEEAATASASPRGLQDPDARAAPFAPERRQLPPEIFDEHKETVAAGEWGWNRDKLTVRVLVLDADRDGKPELVRFVDLSSRYTLRQEEDRTYDGTIDAWTDYEFDVAVKRILDGNDDGKPDAWETYRNGRMSSREIDRDDDGVRDAFYTYEDDSLVREEHDANNDGKVDLRILYKGRRRTSSEEDYDKDGRIDIWSTYEVVDGRELIVRIERDKKGRGFADTFETFEPQDGKSNLARREEDINGDGEVDVISIYRDGKLIRREITNPDLVPL